MPGSILEGYLRAQAHTQEQERLADEKKAQKLEETLNQLRLKQLGQSMAQAAEEFRYQQRKRAEMDEAIARIRAGGASELDYELTGLERPKGPEVRSVSGGYTITDPRTGEVSFHRTKAEDTGEGFRLGTLPIAKGYAANPLTGEIEYTEPEPEVGASALKTAMEALYPRSEQFRETEAPQTAADSLWAGLITEPRAPGEKPFFAGRQRLAGLLTGLGGERRPEPKIELPEELTDELQKFGSFNEWYRNLPPEARNELDAEPETLATIKNWYAVSR